METRKIIFYLLAFFILFSFQIYLTPYFLFWGLIILIFLGFGSREVYFFLITSLVLDLASSLPFGFFFIFCSFLFLSSKWLLNSFLREWTLFTFSLWFIFWQTIFVLIYLFLGQLNFNFFFILEKIIVSEIFAIILFVLFSKIKTFLISYNFISLEKSPIIGF